MNLMQKLNFGSTFKLLNNNQVVYNFQKYFSQNYEGIKGDVNWVNGELVDGRPNIRRHQQNLPKKKYGKVRLITSDFSEELKELKENPIYLTYNRRKRGAGKFEDIVLEEKK
jgi:hypothetical protein